MNNNVYLIHEEDYIRHIDEKVMLYSFVKQLTHHIGRMKPTRANESIMKMAGTYAGIAENLFNSWGIPKSYLVFDDKEALAELMENELIAPEDAGYYPCDDDECDCFPCGCCCCETGDDDGEESVDYGEADDEECCANFFAELASLIHSVFGDNATVHIVLE